MARPKLNRDDSSVSKETSLKIRKNKKTSKSTSPSNEQNVPVRVGGRMKKAKVVFDPSEHYLPKKREQTINNNTSSNESSDTASKVTKLSPPTISSSVIPSQELQTTAVVVKIKKSRTSGTQQQQSQQSSTSSSTTSSSSTNKKSISPGKKTSDDNYYDELCLICLKNGKKGGKILNCTIADCNYKAHVSCLDVGGDDIDISLLENNWQCPHCKTCVVCFENSDDGDLTICSVCEDAYHSICHFPRITKTDDDIKWKCIHCTRLDEQLLKNKTKAKNKLMNALNNETAKTTTLPPLKSFKITIETDTTTMFDDIENNDDEQNNELLSNSNNSSTTTLNNNTENLIEEPQDFAGFSDIETTEGNHNNNKLITNNDIKKTTSESNDDDGDDIDIDDDGECESTRVSSSIKSSSLKRKLSNDNDNEIINDDIDNNDNYNDDNDDCISNQSNKKIKKRQSLSDDRSDNGNDRYVELIASIPDASNWSFDDVYAYFLKHFPNEANIFKEQEIDGASLLLMKRSDVLNGLNLKLGTAIKIYSHIIMLQTRNNDPRLTWM